MLKRSNLKYDNKKSKDKIQNNSIRCYILKMDIENQGTPFSKGVPLIDLSSIRDIADSDLTADMPVVKEIVAACSNWGFFHVINHSLSLELHEKFYKYKEAFFRLEKSEKNTVKRTVENSWGWFDDELTKQKLDWKEGYDMASQDGSLDKRGLEGVNQWPDESAFPSIDGFQATLREYYYECEKLARTLTCAMTLGLGLPSESLVGPEFDNRHTSMLRMNYYPICPDPTANQAIGPHTDAGAVTVLTQSPVKSLQVYQPKDDTWYDVEPIENSFVINTGDIMQVWSNGVYKAPIHRVKARNDAERFSSPFFYNPSYDTNYAPVESMVTEETPAQYKSINWGHFRCGRFAGDYADVGTEIQIEHFRIN